jgi:hypothetical protein
VGRPAFEDCWTPSEVARERWPERNIRYLQERGKGVEIARGAWVRGFFPFLGSLVVSALLVRPSGAQPLQAQDFRTIASQGLGDRQNTIPWSMAFFRGALYVGTGRASFCITSASLDYWMQRLHGYPPERPDVECTPDARDLPLQAEIWRYRPEEAVWDRVYQSPEDVPLDGEPGSFVPRDVGFRGMTVLVEPDGTETLYVGGVSARSLFGPKLPPPRILRSTDAETFEPVPQDPGTLFGDISAAGFRTLLSHGARLYAIASNGLLGYGVLMESEHPADGNDSFRIVSPPGVTVFEIASFNGFLYAGSGVQPLRTRARFSVWKTLATGEPPYVFQEIVSDGAFRDGASTSTVISLQEFQGALYVGTEKELLRLHPDDTWDLVVGEPRSTPIGVKVPLSGLGLGFDSIMNVHVWRMVVHNGWLYVGTQDQSAQFIGIPAVGALLRPVGGCDLYATPNGQDFWVVSRDGFGDIYNTGVRNFASTPYGLFVGEANAYFGLNLSLGTGHPSDLPMPGNLQVEMDGDDAVFSWTGPEGAIRFLLYRDAEFHPSRAIATISAFDAGRSAGAFVFRNSRAKRSPAHYYVVAEDAQGRRSPASRVVRVPPLLPPATAARRR